MTRAEVDLINSETLRKFFLRQFVRLVFGRAEAIVQFKFAGIFDKCGDQEIGQAFNEIVSELGIEETKP
jgi:hypothetical protein